MGRLLTATALAVLCITLLPTPAAADIIEIVTTNDGLGADAMVNGGTHADRNFGGRSDIIPKNGGMNLDVSRKGYLRFELPRSSFGGPLTAAELSLSITVNEAPGNWTFEVYGLDDGAAGDQSPGAGGWIEGVGASFDPLINPDAADGSITWNNAPANFVGHPLAFTSDATVLGRFSVTSLHGPGDLVTFSNLDLLEFLNAGTNDLVTLMFNRLETTTPNVAFASKEHATFAPPTLTLTGPDPAAVPEPSSLALLGLGMAGLAGYAKRRKARPAE